MELTPPEHRLLDCIMTGEVLNLLPPSLGKSGIYTTETVSGWSAKHEIRAVVIRKILRGELLNLDKADCRGIRIRGARISERLDLADLACVLPLELIACALPMGIYADSASFVRFDVERCVIGASLKELKDHEEEGAVRLIGAKVAGQVNFRNTVFENKVGPGFFADRLVVEGNMFLSGSSYTSTNSDQGAVRLLGAKVRGQLDLQGTELSNAAGAALNATGLSVEGDVFLKSLNAISRGKASTVRLLDASIGGGLYLDGATLVNSAGPALAADRLKVEGNVVLKKASCTTIKSDLGAVRLVGASVGGQLDLEDARISNTGGPALIANRLKAREVHLVGNFRFNTRFEKCAIYLVDVHVNNLKIDDAVVQGIPRGCRWLVDGLTYRGYPTEDPITWLNILKKQTTKYAAQPYQQLAQNLRDLGNDGVVRKVLISQRRDQLSRGGTGYNDRLWGYLTGFTVGYGYKPWLALIWLVGLFAFVVWMVFGMYPTGLATSLELTSKEIGTECFLVERWQVVMKMVLPLVSSEISDTCEFDLAKTEGRILAVISMITKPVSWALFTLFVAGFTGIIRKS